MAASQLYKSDAESNLPAAGPQTSALFAENRFLPETPGSAETNPYHGGCTAYLPAKPNRGYPGDGNQGKAKKVIDHFFSPQSGPESKTTIPAHVTYAIALAPDPAQTNLSLFFDREISLIQQAAQDAQYDYDSAWMPWRKGEPSEMVDLASRQRGTDLQAQRQACPGVILFRQRSQKTAIARYDNALVVLVVGELPTGGIDQMQWHNAIHWLNTVKRAPGTQNDQVLRILGPTFSGSLTSLQRALSGLSLSSQASKGTKGRFTRALVLSGSVTSCTAIEAFQQGVKNDSKLHDTVRFGTFNENDSLHIFRFLTYLRKQGTLASDVAILSEDETEYAAIGASSNLPPKASSCNFPYKPREQPVSLFYPRDISALREAYHKQSLFENLVSREHLSHAILREEAELKSNRTDGSDTIDNYSGTLAAVDQEARLFGLVDYMRAHRTRYLVLRATNPLDFLFLTRFFHRAYPEARVVTVGSDLLLRRQIDTPDVRGTLAISSFPLFSESQHWSSVMDSNPLKLADSHMVFGGNLVEGIYIAAQHLLCPQSDFRKLLDRDLFDPSKYPGDSFPLALPRLVRVSDYSDPYWLNGDKPSSHPSTWLSTLGDDGYWPVALLGEQVTGYGIDKLSDHPLHSQTATPIPSTMVRLDSSSSQSFENRVLASNRTESWKKTPLSWEVSLGLAVSLVVYVILGLVKGWKERADGIFYIFVRIKASPTHGNILAFSCALAVMPLMELTLALLLKVGEPSTQSIWNIKTKLTLALLANQATYIFPSLCLILLGSIVAIALLLYGHTYDHRKRKWITSTLFFLVPLLGMTGWYLWTFSSPSYEAIPLFYRFVHLTNGVSPLLPILLFTLGFYLWSWQIAAGSLILAEGRPLLPLRESSKPPDFNTWRGRYRRFLLGIPFYETEKNWNYLTKLHNRLSDELGRRAILSAHPLYVSTFAMSVIAPNVLLILLALWMSKSRNFTVDWPMATIEGRIFNASVSTVLLLAFIFILFETIQFYATWDELRRLLLALGRSRLRRTMASMSRIADDSLWSVSSNVHRVQARIFHQQLDAAKRLDRLKPGNIESLKSAIREGEKVMADSRCTFEGSAKFWRGEVTEENGRSWDAAISMEDPYGPVEWNQKNRNIREVYADTTAEIMNTLLKPAWDQEKTSVYLDTTPQKKSAEGVQPESGASNLALHPDRSIQAAEEFVCCHYLAFIQNIMARMRTIALSTVFLFVTICFAISFYPFAPRVGIATWMLVNLVLIGATVAYVYAGMDRDEILSYITNSRPGRLGPEFWVRFGSFMIGPVIGILATQFPSITDYVLGWLQPGLNAVK